MITENFNSINNFVSIIETRNLNPVFKNADFSVFNFKLKPDSYLNRDSFYELKNYNEAKNFILNGYSKEVKNLKTSIEYQIPTTKNKKFLSPVGCLPVVANAIKNIPCSMLYQKKTKIDNRCITFYYSPTSIASTKGNELLQAGKEFLNLVNHFEKLGIKTKIYILPKFSMDRHFKDLYACKVLVKDFSNPFNILKLSYPLSHPAFFRLQGFLWMETLQNKIEKCLVNSYGISLSKIKIDYPSIYQSQIKELKKANFFEKNSFYLDFQDFENYNYNTEKIIKDIEKFKVN